MIGWFSRFYLRLRFSISLGRKRSHDSDSDSVASENQPLGRFHAFFSFFFFSPSYSFCTYPAKCLSQKVANAVLPSRHFVPRLVSFAAVVWAQHATRSLPHQTTAAKETMPRSESLLFPKKFVALFATDNAPAVTFC